MNELVKITETNGKQVVSARELYEKLGFNTAHWAKWYRKNIIDNEFAIEHVDYEGFTLSVNGNETQDFILSIDFAKRISMMARTEVGEKIRNYFIEVEKALKQIPKTKSEILLEAFNIMQDEITHERAEKERLQVTTELQANQLKLSAPKVEYFDQVMLSDRLIPVTIIAKELGMSGKALNSILNEMNVIYKVSGTWVLHAKYQNKGYTGTKTYTYIGQDGKPKTAIDLYWTEKGRAFLHQLLTVDDIIQGKQNN